VCTGFILDAYTELGNFDFFQEFTQFPQLTKKLYDINHFSPLLLPTFIIPNTGVIADIPVEKKLFFIKKFLTINPGAGLRPPPTAAADRLRLSPTAGVFCPAALLRRDTHECPALQ
jgi:hypothetical protein